MKKISRPLAMLLTLALALSLLCAGVFADVETVLRVANAEPGGDVTELAVTIENNPGFAAMQLTVTLPEGLNFAEDDPVVNCIGATNFTFNPATGQLALALEVNYTADGEIFTLRLTGNAEGEVALSGSVTKATEKEDNYNESVSVTFVSGRVAHIHTFADDGFCSACSALNPDAAAYSVTVPAQLAAVAAAVNAGDSLAGKTVTLAGDINLSAYEDWTPIGTADAPFAGTLDGAGHTVSGLTITDCLGGNHGLVGFNTGVVENLTVAGTIGTAENKITDGAAYSSDNIGGAVGYNGGTVRGVTADVSIYVESNKIYAVGGVVGQNGMDSTVENCLNRGAVEGSKCVGGVVGRNYGAVTRCANLADVTGNYTENKPKNSIGGVVGQSGDKKGGYTSSITSCYNAGTIDNEDASWVGGIAGFVDGKATVENCYNVGTVVGYQQTNPIIGQNEGGANYNYCLKSTIVSDEDGVYNKNGGTKEGNEAFEEAYMRSADFAAKLNEKHNVWLVSCGEYPVLNWQTPKAHSYDLNGVCTKCGASAYDHTVTINNIAKAALSSERTEFGEFFLGVTADKACAVFYTTDGGSTFTALAPAGEGNARSFTLEIGADTTIYVVQRGDLNMNGSVNADDASLAKRIAAGLEGQTAQQTLILGMENIRGLAALRVQRAAVSLYSFEW